jgi:ATP-dependent DNA ligase
VHHGILAHAMRREPWEIRRATLVRLLRKARPGIRLSEHLDGDGETIFRHACAPYGPKVIS